MKFENVLAELNGFGRFQLKTILLMIIPRVTLPFHFLLNNFIAVIPSHHCNISSLDDGGIFRNLSLAERLVVSIPVQEDGTLNSCEMFTEPQYHLLLNSSNMTELSTVPCQSGWVYDNTNFKSALATEWDLVCDKRRVNRATATIFFMGVMLGAPVFGYLSDRFFTGFGISGISIITIVLCIEWVDIKHRTAVGVFMSMDWSVCTAVLPILGYFVNDWRHLTITVTAPLFLAMITWWWLPESARWQISNGKINSAHYYLSKCAKTNGREQFMADLKPEVLSKVILVENENRKYSYLDLVRTPRMRRRAVLTGLVWFGVACTYYGISLNVAGFGLNIYLTQFIYGAIELPAKFFVFFSLKRIGRRLNQSGTLVITALCIFCNILIPQDQGLFRTAVGALGKMFAEASFTTVYLYTSELYPTVMRQNGLGYCAFMARSGVSLSPLIMLLEDIWGYLPSTVFTLVAVGAGLSASFLPETQNIRLPETIEDVEHTRRRSVCTSNEKSQPPNIFLEPKGP
ncbi:solute carrier family 22 member 7-like isoform X2 [Plectropomus leopardus]|uniref:solute carrier family 22 member 7-like isoform X2 n=1 Tax=Plectropomus leopardus TaxID=160734 RepID=UPI001C4C32AC|nr:solute carrier family 22 member 7-like isoform X2 [Plectropomus leopardus]